MGEPVNLFNDLLFSSVGGDECFQTDNFGYVFVDYFIGDELYSFKDSLSE
jgi:hypothetical protein